MVKMEKTPEGLEATLTASYELEEANAMAGMKGELGELWEHLITQQMWSKPKMGKISDAHFYGDEVTG